MPESKLKGVATPMNYISVGLTFDDGPTKGVTDRLLQVLKEKEIKASFFVIGKAISKINFEEMYSTTMNALQLSPTEIASNAVNLRNDEIEWHRDILHKMIEHGHLVGNHSTTHPWKSNREKNQLGLAKLFDEDVIKELVECQEIIYEASGNHYYRPRFFRAPEFAVSRVKDDCEDYFLDVNVIEKNNANIGFAKTPVMGLPFSGSTTYSVGYNILQTPPRNFINRLTRKINRIIKSILGYKSVDWDDTSWKSDITPLEIAGVYKQITKLSVGTKLIILSHDSPQSIHVAEGVKKGLENIFPSEEFPGFHYYGMGIRRKYIKFECVDEFFAKHNCICRGEYLLKGQRLQSSNKKFDLSINASGILVTYEHANGKRKPICNWTQFGTIDKLKLSYDGDLKLEANGNDTLFEQKVFKIELTNDGDLALYVTNEPFSVPLIIKNGIKLFFKK